MIPVEPDDDSMTVEEFRQDVEDGALMDSDGFGYAAKNGMMDESSLIRPSDLGAIPGDATHIVWFNKYEGAHPKRRS